MKKQTVPKVAAKDRLAGAALVLAFIAGAIVEAGTSVNHNETLVRDAGQRKAK